MSKFDPYEVLGVDRDATEDDIKKAAKEQVRKVHPDAGGDEDAFIENRRALAILLDQKKRKRFDQTGDADEIKPDNAGANAMQIISVELSQLTNAYLMSNFDPAKDPRKIDIVAVIRGNIERSIREAKSTRLTGEQQAGFLRDLVERFKRRARTAAEAFDFISRNINDEIAEVEKRIKDVDQMIVDAELALTMLESYSFKFDPPTYVYAPAGTFNVRYP